MDTNRTDEISGNEINYFERRFIRADYQTSSKVIKIVYKTAADMKSTINDLNWRGNKLCLVKMNSFICLKNNVNGL